MVSLIKDLKAFQGKHKKRIRKVSIIILGLALFLFLLKNIIFFALLTIGTGIITFFVNRLRIPFDLSPIFFSSVLVMYFYGLSYAVLFLLFASLIPSILGGSTIDFVSILSLLSILAVSSLVFLTSVQLPLVLVLILVYSTASFLITLRLTNDPGRASVTLVVSIFVNAAYFVTLSKPFVTLGNLIAG